MKKEASALKRAFKAAEAAMGPKRYGPHGKPFVCHLCGHDEFTYELAPVLVLHTLVCADCGHVEFFGKQPECIGP